MSFQRLLGTALLLTCAVSNASANGRNPGSVLIYPVHNSDRSVISIVSVTNTNPSVRGGTTRVHFEYVNSIANPADPLLPLGCTIFDRIELLTPADTLSVSTGCHNPTAPGASSGYLVVSAESTFQFGVRWSFNYLIGSSIQVSWTGAVYSTLAIPFASPLQQGTATDVNQNGQLNFDNIEYEGTPDALLVPCFMPDPTSLAQVSLVNLTGGPRAVNTIYLSIWNDDEFPLSATFRFSCWMDESFWWFSPLFEVPYFFFFPNSGRECDIDCDGNGDMETGWAMIDSIDVSHPDGTPISNDGAIVGSYVPVFGGELVWESFGRQTNGAFATP